MEDQLQVFVDTIAFQMTMFLSFSRPASAGLNLFSPNFGSLFSLSFEKKLLRLGRSLVFFFKSSSQLVDYVE